MSQSVETESLFTLAEASAFLKCHPNTLRLWDKNGVLSAIRIGLRRQRRYRQQDLITFLTQSPKQIAEKTSSVKELVQSIIADSPDGIFVKNLKREYVFINPRGETLLGASNEQILGKTDFAFFPKIVAREIDRIDRKVIRTGTSQTQEIPLIINRKKYIFQSNKRPQRNAQGKIIGLIGIIRDITEQRQTLEAVETYRERLELAQKAGNIGIFEWNMQTSKIWWSAQQAKLWGVGEQESTVTALDWEKRMHPDDVLKLQRVYTMAVTTKAEEFEADFRIILPDETIRWLKCKAHIFYNSKGIATYQIGVNFDITDRKNIEELLRFKAEASRILSSSLEYRKTLAGVGKVAVPYIADWFAVDLVTDSGEIEQIILLHKDPEKIKFAAQLRAAIPQDTNVSTGVGKVIRTGVVEFIPLITDEMIRQTITSKKQLRLIKQVGFTSIIIVPLTVHGKTIGALTFVTAESKRRFTQYDLQILEQIASRASLAIENAMLYEDVKHERERLAAMVSDVPSVVWEAYGKPDESTQQIDFVNDHVEKMLGYTKQEWLDTPNFWLTIVHPDDSVRAAKEAADIFASGGAGISRFRWITRQGKTIWVEAQSQVIKDEHGKAIGMRGVTIDISERVEEEKRKDDFISMASHELKTPVTSIKAFTQILPKFILQDPNKAIIYLKKTEMQIDKLTKLITDLLDVAKVEQGKMHFSMERFDLADLIQEVTENLQAITADHLIDHSGCTSCFVFGDRERISQVVVNLITNAVKYSPNADKVVIACECKNETAIVSVKDFGVGIPKTHQQKIFERFYRVFDDTDKKFPGLGIGLFIASQIIARHDGKIWVKSNGTGSTFFFTLPVMT